MKEFDNYQEYLIFSDKFDISAYDYDEESFNELSEVQKEIEKVNAFLEIKYNDSSEHHKYNNLNFIFIQNFPRELIAKWMKINLKTRDICYQHYLHIEIVKYTYLIWHTYLYQNPDNFDGSSKLLCKIINKIYNHLVEIPNMDPIMYYDILENKMNPKYNRDRNYIYYSWWLYVYYPLIDNCEELILKLISFAYLDDAEDMLLYGIYHMPTSKLAKFIKKFILVIWNQDKKYNELHRIDINSTLLEKWRCGRPCLSMRILSFEIIKIFKKLMYDGFNLLSDSDFYPIFLHGDTNNKDVSFISYINNQIGNIEWCPENHHQYTSRIQEIIRLFLLINNYYRKKLGADNTLIPKYIRFQIIRNFVS